MVRVKRIFLLILGSAIFTGVVTTVTLTNSATPLSVTLTPQAYLPYLMKEEPTPNGPLPDLTINYVRITLENASCYDGSSLGTRAVIANIGLGDAGPFVVDIDSTAVIVDGLAAGSTTSVWVPGYLLKPTVIVDATNMVPEANESNNFFHEYVPIPTLPLPCPTPTTEKIIEPGS